MESKAEVLKSECELSSSKDCDEEDNKWKADQSLVERRKLELQEARKNIARLELRLTEETVKAQKRRKEIFQAQHGMGLFDCKADMINMQTCEYLALMRDETSLCPCAEADEANKKQIQ